MQANTLCTVSCKLSRHCFIYLFINLLYFCLFARTKNYYTCEGASPGGHDNYKYHLFPHHAPEVNKGFWQGT